MTDVERPLRADAQRNRRRLLDAAAAAFSERGLDVSVAEIAQRAEIGRGTLFRNFASKEDLIAAIVVDRMARATELGRELLDGGEAPGDALFAFLNELVCRQQMDRALFDAIEDQWLANEEIRAAHAQVLGVLEALLRRAQEAGTVRSDVGALDVMMLVKGVCETATAFAHVDADIAGRHLDLVLAALRTPAATQPLRGRTPTLEDIEGGAAFPPEAAA
jgi:AcrR family transcriptional regulator